MTDNDDRPHRTREEVRAQVLRAAGELFSEHGIAGASIDDIGARAGFTKGAVYSNFRTKSHLVVELMDAQLSDQLGAAASRLTSGLDVEQVLEVVREELGPITLERRRAFALASEFRLYTERHPEALVQFTRLRARTHETVRAILGGYLEQHPEITLALTTDEVASLVIALVLGVAFDADVPGTPSAGDLIARVLLAIRR